MKNILLTSIICFVLTLSAFGQVRKFDDKGLIKPKVESVELQDYEPVKLVPSDPAIDDLARKDFEAWQRAQNAKRWQQIADSKQGDKFYARGIRYRSGGDVEVWLKMVPSKPALTGKLRSYRYMVSFATFHCDDKRVTTESGILYDARGRVLYNLPSFLARSYRDPINPDSVNESIWETLCTDRRYEIP
jgi:hypothetical protein